MQNLPPWRVNGDRGRFMAEIGGGIEQLQQLQISFNNQGEAVTTLMAAIDRDLGNTYWVGPAAERFKDSWNSQYKTALTNLRQGLIDAGQEVGRRREALIQAGG